MNEDRTNPVSLADVVIAVGEVAAGVVAGLAASQLTNDPVPSAIFGLLVTIGLITLIGFWRLSNDSRHLAGEIQHNRSQIDAYAQTVGKQQCDLQDHVTVLGYSQRPLGRDEVASIWRHLISRFQRTYMATNYIRSFAPNDGSPDFYSEAFAEQANELLGHRVKWENITARKVMIVDDACELAAMSKAIHRQVVAGIGVRYIFSNAVRDDDALKRLLSQDDPADFGVFDGRTVLLWALKDRHVSGGRVVPDEKTAKPYVDYFERLWSLAVTLPPIKLSEAGDKEREQVLSWPRYSGDFSAYNYALEKERGWLQPGAFGDNVRRYAAYDGPDFVGFSLLVPDPATEDGRRSAEFYICVRGNCHRKGYGRAITIATLREAFEKLHYETVHLKVRTWNDSAAKLYADVGFRHAKTVSETINGDLTQFNKMTMQARGDWDTTKAPRDPVEVTAK